LIKAQKTYIRVIEEDDIELLHKWWSSGEVMAHAGFKYGLVQSFTAHKNGLMKEIEDRDVFRSSRRFIIVEKDTDLPIGEINYHNFDKFVRKCEIGIKICEVAEQGKGPRYDAVSTFIEFLFESVNLNKNSLDTGVKNTREQKFYEKLGFKKIGVINKEI